MNGDDFVPPSNTLLPFVVDPAAPQHPLVHPGCLPASSLLGPALPCGWGDHSAYPPTCWGAPGLCPGSGDTGAVDVGVRVSASIS